MAGIAQASALALDGGDPAGGRLVDDELAAEVVPGFDEDEQAERERGLDQARGDQGGQPDQAVFYEQSGAERLDRRDDEHPLDRRLRGAQEADERVLAAEHRIGRGVFVGRAAEVGP